MDSIQPIILIVDDEKHTRDGLRRLLEDDYDVYVAGDIASAMNVLEREHVDLVLTDLRLGGEDGMQLIDRALKLPAAAFSAPDQSIACRLRRRGADRSGQDRHVRARERSWRWQCHPPRKRRNRPRAGGAVRPAYVFRHQRSG